MKNYKLKLDAKLNALNATSFDNIRITSEARVDTTYIKLSKLFKDSEMTEEGIIEIVGITFIIEALILSEPMREERLTDLDQEEVESLALELYLTLAKEKSEGAGYIQLCDAVNHIIDRHLSRICTLTGKEASDEKH